eukprot:TRINITY_DN5726_c0_g2_i2.p1 TRINITY_DN5726_c0_g2~~TRINITY_DN5726_c0_g2_i2.p1  ORF type:complete len:389 (-),score=84.09 TRINITY_DN5726_c0_g2_i2:164-1330(-)
MSFSVMPSQVAFKSSSRSFARITSPAMSSASPLFNSYRLAFKPSNPLSTVSTLLSQKKIAGSRRAASVVRGAIGDSLEEFLAVATEDEKLRQLMMSMSEAIRTIAFKVKTASCAATACINTFGDEQLAVDVLADKLLFESLKFSGCCKYACSEEVPEPVDMQGSGFSVAFDPLDGSSIVDTNFTVGTIFGVWPGDELKGITGRDQAAAGMGIYGPRTVYCIALKDYPGCHEFLLQDDGKWLHVKETTEIGEGKMFSPGNLRATFDNPAYEKLVSYWIGEKYTLRYTGGMVPDVFQIIVKEKGVFSNVTSPSTKAKLRILFEVAPLGLLVEKAGGFSSCDGLLKSALDIPIESYDQRTQVCYGSIGEVRRFEEYLYGNSPRFSEVTASM